MYELKAGQFSEGDTYMKIIDLLRQLQDQYSILGHYIKENGHDLKGQGFLAIGEMMKAVEIQTIGLATNKMRKSAGYR